ncbi:MAG: helix-turn-helix transcriptional regulator [Waterburya sp.]
MTIYLSAANAEELEHFTPLSDDEAKWDFSGSFGNQQTTWIGLRNKINIWIRDEKFSKSIVQESFHQDFDFIQSGFILSGGKRVVTPNVSGVEDDYENVTGSNYLFYLPNLREFEYHSAKVRSQEIMIGWDLDLLSSFQTTFAKLSTPLQQLIEGRTEQNFRQPLGKMTSEMRSTLQQIINCPYHGALKQIYLEGNALKLIALQIAQWLENDQTWRCGIKFRADEVERLHYAKAVLEQNFAHPPSLLELARQIELNDYKLKRGFKELFGTTVFTYVKSLRFQQAKQLLKDKNMAIAQVAHAVGYESESHFSCMFKRLYKQTPKEYRRDN